jgi:hypothetical protein
VHLGVVELGKRAPLAAVESLVVEQHRRGDEGAGEAAASRLVPARYKARAVRAVELEEARGGAPAALAAVRGGRPV